MNEERSNVYVVVHQGMVVEAYAPKGKVWVEVLDFDTQDEEELQELDEQLEEIQKTMESVY